MQGTFFDGSRMRTRCPGENNLYAGIDVVAKFVIGFFMLIGIIAWNTLRDAVSSPAKTSNDFTLDRL
ncbi:MAG TPA: hypothetical protein VK148_15400 [Xanthobacteraceae bacterium]|jgi:hypothetical protein|nr:hypothetical protein [Xanthobacteraceae bacterium]